MDERLRVLAPTILASRQHWCTAIRDTHRVGPLCERRIFRTHRFHQLLKAQVFMRLLGGDSVVTAASQDVRAMYLAAPL